MFKRRKRQLTIIYPFRSFHNEEFNRKVIDLMLVPAIFTIVQLLSMDLITTLWGIFYEYYLPKLGLENAVSYKQYNFLTFGFAIPYINIPGSPPSTRILDLTTILSLVALLFSFFIPEVFTPLKYFLRVIIFVMFTAILYFWLSPDTFPYNISIYMRINLLQIMGLMLITPWIFGFTYYLFSYKYAKKIFITILTLAFLAIAGPLQTLLNTYMLTNISLLFLPVLYIFFGFLVNIFVIIAFYSYGISLEQVVRKKVAD
jgi:hypothetical protein